MFCQTHKTKMIQLLTSWVCDVCSPPVGQIVSDTKNNLLDPLCIAGLPPGKLTSLSSPAAQHTCMNNYQWKLWYRDPTELHVPRATSSNLYYLQSNQHTPINHQKLLFFSSVVVRIYDDLQGLFGCSYMKHRYSSAAPFRGLSYQQYQDLIADLMRVKFRGTQPCEHLVYFLDVENP